MYEQLVPIILPVLIATGIGFAWARLKLPFDREFMTGVIMNVGTPCLILQGISGLPTGNVGFLRMVALGIAAHAACGLVGLIGLRLLRLPVRSYLPLLVFGNAVNLGLPLCMFAFGQEGLGLGVGYVLVGSVGQFILGPLVQKYAFGIFWSGFPLGTDLTDNKTVIMFFFWIVALAAGRKGRPARLAVLAASVVTLVIYLIPHSLFGSELKYGKMK